MKPRITSEFNRLLKVLTHTPGPEHQQLIPWEGDHPLMGPDPHSYRELQQDHGRLKQFVSEEIEAENVYELCELLEQIFEKDDYHHRYKILQDTLHNVADTYVDHLQARGIKLQKYKPSELVKDLIEGYPRTLTVNNGRLPNIIIPPMRELMWIRDPAIITPQGVVISYMASSRRQMEPALLRTIFKYHDMFDPDTIFLDMLSFVREMEDDPTWSGLQEKYLLEGGDIMVLGEDTIAIGVGKYDFIYSNRTTRQGFNLLAKKLFEADKEKKLKRIYLVNIPDLKGFLHLDTVFNMVGPKSAVVMPYIFGHPRPSSKIPANKVIQQFIGWLRGNLSSRRTDLSKIPTEDHFEHAGKVEVYDRDYFDKIGSLERLPQPSKYFLDQLIEDGWLDPNLITWIGGNPDDYPSPFEHLKVALFDQQNMAGNVFVTAPYHVLAYHRNPTTIDALRQTLGKVGAQASVQLMSSNELRTDNGGPKSLVLPLLRME